jgi:CRP-like cAMP-binding protein
MQRGTAGGATVQRHAIRPVQAGRSAQHVQVPGALGRQQLAEHLDETRDFGTPRGFWDEQISSRSYGQHSLDPVGREAVTRGFFEVKTEVRNLLRREGTGASEVTVAATDVAEEAQAIEERRRIRELFLMIDTDGSNSLERVEVEELLRGLGKKLDESAVDEAMAQMDRDGGGDISFNEFLEWWQQIGSKMGAQRMLNNATARRFIYDVPMFQKLVEPKFIAMLATMLKPRSYKKGAVIINRGEIGQEMFFVMTGTAVAQLDLAEDALAVGTLGPGSFFGEQAMIRDEPRNAYVRTVTDVEVLVLDKADLMKALESFPHLVESLFKETMEVRMRTNEQREANYQPSWTARQPVDPRAVSTVNTPAATTCCGWRAALPVCICQTGLVQWHRFVLDWSNMVALRVSGIHYSARMSIPSQPGTLALNSTLKPLRPKHCRLTKPRSLCQPRVRFHSSTLPRARLDAER